MNANEQNANARVNRDNVLIEECIFLFVSHAINATLNFESIIRMTEIESTHSFLFYLSHIVGGRIKALVDGLRIIQLSRHNKKQQELRLSGNFVIPSQDTVDSRIYVIKNEFYKHIKINKSFARHLIIAEWLNVINLILQIKLTDMFLANQFMTLGPEFIRDNFTGEMDVLDFVFPKVTKCNFYKYGQSGSVQRHDALCIMALNIINEKIYVILWFWFVLMVIVSIGAFIWRLVTLMLYG